MTINSYDFEVISGCTDEVGKIITSAIKNAKYVYAFRTHTHILQNSELIKWFMLNASEQITELVVNFITKDVRQVCKSFIDQEMVYKLELTQENKIHFMNRFKIATRDLRIDVKKELSDPIFVDDPIYDQYDFIFAADDKLILLTSLHDYNFLLSKEVVEFENLGVT